MISSKSTYKWMEIIRTEHIKELNKMATEIVLPKLGLTMDEAKVVTWLKEIGDFVKENEVLLEVETDKANLEVESPGEGYLVQKDVEPGDVVEVGKVLGMLADQNESF